MRYLHCISYRQYEKYLSFSHAYAHIYMMTLYESLGFIIKAMKLACHIESKYLFDFFLWRKKLFVSDGTPGFRWDTCQSKESIIDFSSLQASVITETKRERDEKNIKNIFLHTVVNLPFVIVFGRWLFIDLRCEIKQQKQIKHNRFVLCHSLAISFGLKSGSPTNTSRVNILIQQHTQRPLDFGFTIYFDSPL